MEDIIMESVENLNGNVSQKIISCKGGHDENQQVPSKILPKLFYSRDLLIKLKNHPSSKEKPAIFDDLDRVKNGMWDPEHWHSRTAKEPKRSNLGTVVGAGNKEDQQEKKRGKEEGDEFCFTPQRRSFVSGCHVVRRQDAEPAVPPVVTESVRESTLPARRVGSGRLTGRDVEPAPVPTKEPRDRREPLRAPAPQRERTFDREPQRNERGNERNDRHDRNERNERSERNGRTFQPSRADPRDKDPAEKDRRNFDRSGYDRDYSGRGDRSDRYNSRRKNEDDTPEWFFGGPSSQHDTIELRGFDEEKDRKQTSKAPVRKESNKERQQSSGAKKSEEPATSSSRPGSGLSGKIVKEDQPPKTEAPKRKSPVNQDKMDFNIEDFLKMDGDLNGLGLGPTESEETSRGSKASRWFGKTSDVPEASKPPTTENVKTESTNQDAARSLLEMLQKGSQQQQSVEHKKIVTAEELERSSGKFSNNERSSDDGMTVFNKLLAQVQESTTKPHSVMNSAPTEQDILANLLGKQMKIEAQPQPIQHHAQQTQQDALAKFLQQQQSNQMHHPNTQQHNTHQMLQQPLINHLHQQQQQSHLFSMHGEQPHSDVHSLMRDLANGHPQTLNQLHMMTMQKQHQQQQQHLQQQQQQQLQQYQQQHHQQQQHQQQHQQQQQQHQQQQQQRQAFVGSPQQSVAKQSASSSSPLSFTPTAVMRKMGAEKDKAKAASLDKGDGAETGMGTTSSPPASQSSATSNRLTGRTASQVQGASRVSNQMRMNDVPVVQQQQQLLTGRPLVKGQESMLPFQQQQQSQQAGNRPFGLASASNAAITGVAVKMLEQQQQHQLLAAAVAASANQTQQQLKQQILQQQQQQQRTSPLQQSLLAFAAGGLQSNMALQNRGIPTNVPVGNRTHFRPIHPQPMIPPISGYSPYMGNQASLQTGQSRLPNNIGSSSNQFYGISPASNIRGQAQGLNALAALQQQAFSGNRSPNMLQGGNSLSRWFPPEIFSQAGSGQMPTLPPMPSQKILSLEELERLHTSPMSH